MANYYGTGRSNYFYVKDVSGFSDWLKKLGGLEFIQDKQGRVGFYTTTGDGDVPTRFYNETTDEYIDIDFFSELAAHLIEDEEEVAIFIHSGAEKARYIVSFAVAVNSKGEQERVELESIYDKASRLGKNITRAEY